MTRYTLTRILYFLFVAGCLIAIGWIISDGMGRNTGQTGGADTVQNKAGYNVAVAAPPPLYSSVT